MERCAPGRHDVLVSIAVGGNESCAWLGALVDNALAFTHASTRVVMHVSSESICDDVDLHRLNGTAQRIALSPSMRHEAR